MTTEALDPRVFWSSQWIDSPRLRVVHASMALSSGQEPPLDTRAVTLRRRT
ncbi:hypothetical protein [Variovorax atrisoli]|uniref:hypothetical protein n=1 Tax=Variovorax atrisoli TaxID=3394203 RepID=UPI0016197AA5|nr:hypothetical protein [Variovorax sp. BK613]MBB3643511.1 hypothetical protein [Variovorax sp. BK613]